MKAWILATRRMALAALVLLAAAALPASAETYTIDAVHSQVKFSIRHIVTKSGGRFNKFNGTIVYDEKDPAKSSVEAVIDTASIDTANANRDAHLRSADFFDVEKFPSITFKSKKVVPGEGGKLKVTGDFTMHGVTKEITLDAEFLGSMVVREDWPPKAGFSATTTIKRNDFGVGDPGTVMLGDEVYITLEIEANGPAPAPKEEPKKEEPKKEEAKKDGGKKKQ